MQRNKKKTIAKSMLRLPEIQDCVFFSLSFSINFLKFYCENIFNIRLTPKLNVITKYTKLWNDEKNEKYFQVIHKDK